MEFLLRRRKDKKRQRIANFSVSFSFSSSLNCLYKDNFNGNQCSLFVRSRLKMIRQTNEIDFFFVFLAAAVDLRCATSSLFTQRELSLTRKCAWRRWFPRKVIRRLKFLSFFRFCACVCVVMCGAITQISSSKNCEWS